MLVALISAVTAAGGLIVDKITLSRRNVPLAVFIPVVFVFLFAFTAVFTPLYGYIDWNTAMLPNNLFLALLMIVIAIAWNVLAYQSLQRESVHQHEVILMTGPIVTILLAALFFREEFNLTIFILALVASLAMLIARTERRHLKFDKIAYNLFLAVILMSIESIIVALRHPYLGSGRVLLALLPSVNEGGRSLAALATGTLRRYRRCLDGDALLRFWVAGNNLYHANRNARPDSGLFRLLGDSARADSS